MHPKMHLHTDYGCPQRKQPSLHGRKFNSKFLGTVEAYFVCHINPIFQIYLIQAFIGCPQSVHLQHIGEKQKLGKLLRDKLPNQVSRDRYLLLCFWCIIRIWHYDIFIQSRFTVRNSKKRFLTIYWFVEQGTSEQSEWYKIDPGWSGELSGLIYNQFGINQVLQRSPIPQISIWSGTFFAVSYSKPALAVIMKLVQQVKINYCEIRRKSFCKITVMSTQYKKLVPNALQFPYQIL